MQDGIELALHPRQLPGLGVAALLQGSGEARLADGAKRTGNLYAAGTTLSLTSSPSTCFMGMGVVGRTTQINKHHTPPRTASSVQEERRRRTRSAAVEKDAATGLETAKADGPQSRCSTATCSCWSWKFLPAAPTVGWQGAVMVQVKLGPLKCGAGVVIVVSLVIVPAVMPIYIGSTGKRTGSRVTGFYGPLSKCIYRRHRIKILPTPVLIPIDTKISS